MTLRMICFFDSLLVPTYLALTATALMSLGSPWLSALAAHGKTRLVSRERNNDRTARSSLLITLFRQFHEFLVVPKRFFLHFYIVGLVALLLVERTTTPAALAPFPTIHQQLLVTILIGTHLIRRSFECLWVHVWSEKSRMHLAGYALGLLHYLLLPWAFVDYHSDCRDDHEGKSDTTAGETTALDMLVIFAAVTVNLWAQHQQFRHHELLADLRRRQPTGMAATPSPASISNSNQYQGPPTEGWFQYVACPHYLAEIMLYASLAVLQPTAKSAALLLWVAVNLTVSAHHSQAWYQKHVVGYKDRKLTSLVPYVM